MKKLPALTTIFGLLAAVLIFSLSACKKDTSAADTSLTGKWIAKQFGNNSSIIQQYEFKSNDSVEFYAYQIDTVTKKILGYSYKVVGTYTLNNTTLILSNQAVFTNPANSFGPVTALVAAGTEGDATYTTAINKQNNKVVLSLYFTCPPYADCVPSPLIYYKQ